MSAEALSALMLITLAATLLAGFPVSFTLGAVAAVFGVFGVMFGYFDLAFLTAITFRVQGMFQNDNFFAVPFLVLMGMLLARTGIAEDMLLALERIMGGIGGGLGYATILVGAVLSAITGFVSASVIAVGLIALPAMLRAGYDQRLASGLVAASGTLAQILPPSLVLIVLAEQLEISLIDIYRGALLPAMILILLYAGFVFVIARIRPNAAPSSSERQPSGPKRAWWDLFIMAGIPIALVALVLGCIYFGVATPGEAGAIGAAGAMVLGIARRRLSVGGLRTALGASAVLCTGLMFLLLGASFFTLVFRGLNGHLWIEALFLRQAAGAFEFVVFVNVVVFLLAFVLDFFEIAFIVLPLLAPIAHKLGVDMVWFAVLLAINLQTSFMHPPFGIALYNLRSVAPASIRTPDIYWGAVPFILLQLVLVLLLIFVPALVLKEKVAPIDVREVIIDIPSAYEPVDDEKQNATPATER